jgi:hypothetical protein
MIMVLVGTAFGAIAGFYLDVPMSAIGLLMAAGAAIAYLDSRRTPPTNT